MKGSRHWASTPQVSPRSRQSATGPPDSYPDRTHTGKRRRAYEHRSPTQGHLHSLVAQQSTTSCTRPERWQPRPRGWSRREYEHMERCPRVIDDICPQVVTSRSDSQLLRRRWSQATSDAGASGDGSGMMPTGRSRTLPLWNSAPARKQRHQLWCVHRPPSGPSGLDQLVSHRLTRCPRTRALRHLRPQTHGRNVDSMGLVVLRCTQCSAG